MDAPAFPTSEADLADWSVYADFLQTRGDPRGELIAREMSRWTVLPPTNELRDGSVFTIRSIRFPTERTVCTFVARDLDAMLRSMHAGGPRR